ncbi:sirohydrochlorin chelatase [Streptomyces sp. Je 1-369]|uniref:sirohydrochlorin chelatase n=1 Tax=Streptomyces sp. Je 1-369 TaxID=2966192 RepID=UPI0022863B33|nr:CbiX/SirB N-terminal domain-containing protein [Streptomyces sp. Je 1-369]WAL96063.1 sirohydrochlorin chelatase [Streptomyces sp. Je 1-369]
MHGSPVPGAAYTLGRLCDRVEELGGVRPALGHLSHLGHLGHLDHLDHRTASLTEALQDGSVVVPLLLGDGYHRTVDIPAAIRSHKGHCVLTDGLSGDRAVALALRDRLHEAERRAGVRADAVVLAAAGSSRPGGNSGARIAVRQLRQLLRGVPVCGAYCSSAGPTVPEAVARLRGAGFQKVAVAAHLLAPGRFAGALAGAEADAVAEPIADHPEIARLVLRRYETALHRPGGPVERLGAAA